VEKRRVGDGDVESNKGQVSIDEAHQNRLPHHTLPFFGILVPGPWLFKVGLVLLDEGELVSVKHKEDQVPKCLEKIVLRK
jgi:hypothetical protein